MIPVPENKTSYPKWLHLRVPTEILQRIMKMFVNRHQTFRSYTFDKTRLRGCVWVTLRKQQHQIFFRYAYHDMVGTTECPMMLWDLTVDGPTHILEWLIGSSGPLLGCWASIYDKEV